MSQTHLARDAELAFHLVQAPLPPFARVEEIDAQPRHHRATVGLLLPVDGKGIEVVALEVHHGEQRVHQPVFEPSLSVLTNLRIGVPSSAAVARQVIELANRRTTIHHPGFHALHGITDRAYNVGNVTSSLVVGNGNLPRLRIADIVQVNTVNIVFLCYLSADTCQILSRFRTLGVHESLVADLADGVGHLLSQHLGGRAVPLAYWQRHHPGVTLHAALVTLVDAELQRVVARRFARLARQVLTPRLYVAGVYHAGTHSRVHQYRIDVRSLQLVQNLTEVLLLLLVGGAGPVESHHDGEPHGPDFMFWHRRVVPGQGGGHLSCGVCRTKEYEQCKKKKLHRFVLVIAIWVQRYKLAAGKPRENLFFLRRHPHSSQNIILLAPLPAAGDAR